MNQGIQTVLQEAGEAACYALCLGHVAQERLNHELTACTVLDAAIDGKYVHYDPNNSDDNNNFYVDYPAGLLGALTGEVWDVRREDADYVPKPGEYVIERWERVKTGTTTGHFKRPNWNSLVHSATVEQGRLVSLRICKVIE
jgi:hypothetical protein